MGSVHSQGSDTETASKENGNPARRNDSGTSVVSSKSTITFEKKKVPPRGRTHSVQSVFSGMSLKSTLQNNVGLESGNNSEGGSTNGIGINNVHGGVSAAGTGVNASQLIQSPGITSANIIRRRNPRNSNVSTKNAIAEDREIDVKIGERLPFTELQLKQGSSSNQGNTGGGGGASNSSTTTVSTAVPEDSSATLQKLDGTPISDHSCLEQARFQEDKQDGQNSQECAEDEEDFVQQKMLTKDALRKLSMLQAGKAASPGRRPGAGNEGITDSSANTDTIGPNEELNDAHEPLTHLQFGGKHVILDTSRKNSIPVIRTPSYEGSAGFQLPSATDMLYQPETSRQPTPSQRAYQNVNGNNNANASHFLLHQDETLRKQQQQQQQQKQQLQLQHLQKQKELNQRHFNKKKPIRQINEPKKPLYKPAVLRDISETNIGWNRSKSHSPAPNTDVTQVNNTFQRTNHSTYASSTHSVTSSFLSEYRRKFDLWFGHGSGDKRSGQTAQVVHLVPPTRKHWVSDNKRQSCKYCHKLFTFWERKHHCRHCGDIFCQQHVRHWLYLNPDANFLIGGGGLGMLSKICDTCLEEYEKLVRDGPNSSNISGGNTDQSDAINTSPTFGTNKKAVSARAPGATIDSALEGDDKAGDTSGRQLLDTFVGSVPADWSWSSF
ncbi:HER228Wp [Eremothecium sinecaudum]|uniref:HER228Wp n=1 Tax=Eremothecium sinecaudum TaxID=45286 RepID=A0A0X8HTG2_9SACH|nr:HER228Wp [Eremothecium sinecaudum]AMD21506.1 HER228Wp [Eremothecium sinecaudum]